MARQEGLEPPAYCLEGSCSILLSYWRILRRQLAPAPGSPGRARKLSYITITRAFCQAPTHIFQPRR